jgi:hypothetical protein
MKIEVTQIKQNDDGSATVIVDTDAEANEFLLKYGIVSAIEDAVTKSKEVYTPEERVATDKEIEHDMMKSEIYEMRKILSVQDEKLREQAHQLVEYNNTIETMGQVIDSYLAKHKARGQE